MAENPSVEVKITADATAAKEAISKLQKALDELDREESKRGKGRGRYEQPAAAPATRTPAPAAAPAHATPAQQRTVASIPAVTKPTAETSVGEEVTKKLGDTLKARKAGEEVGRGFTKVAGKALGAGILGAYIGKIFGAAISTQTSIHGSPRLSVLRAGAGQGMGWGMAGAASAALYGAGPWGVAAAGLLGGAIGAWTGSSDVLEQQRLTRDRALWRWGATSHLNDQQIADWKHYQDVIHGRPVEKTTHNLWKDIRRVLHIDKPPTRPPQETGGLSAIARGLAHEQQLQYSEAAFQRQLSLAPGGPSVKAGMYERRASTLRKLAEGLKPRMDAFIEQKRTESPAFQELAGYYEQYLKSASAAELSGRTTRWNTPVPQLLNGEYSDRLQAMGVGVGATVNYESINAEQVHYLQEIKELMSRAVDELSSLNDGELAVPFVERQPEWGV